MRYNKKNPPSEEFLVSCLNLKSKKALYEALGYSSHINPRTRDLVKSFFDSYGLLEKFEDIKGNNNFTSEIRVCKCGKKFKWLRY